MDCNVDPIFSRLEDLTCRKKGNITAHLLARGAAEGDCPIYWIEDPPIFIMDQFTMDVTSTF